MEDPTLQDSARYSDLIRGFFTGQPRYKYVFSLVIICIMFIIISASCVGFSQKKPTDMTQTVSPSAPIPTKVQYTYPEKLYLANFVSEGANTCEPVTLLTYLDRNSVTLVNNTNQKNYLVVTTNGPGGGQVGLRLLYPGEHTEVVVDSTNLFGEIATCGTNAQMGVELKASRVSYLLENLPCSAVIIDGNIDRYVNPESTWRLKKPCPSN